MATERIDLNLLKVFDAVFEELNLLRAGRRLNLSQSAVSHALTRLREAVGDELFVRTAKGMMPTARASAMAGTLRDCLRGIDAALGVDTFVPAESTRRFVIAANDHVTAVVVSELNRRLALEAPGIDLAEQIDVGRIDLAIGIFAQVPPRLSSQALQPQTEAIVMRKGHPATRRKLRVRDLAHYPLLTVSVGGREEGAVGGYILERGLARQAEMFDRRALEEALAQEKLAPRFRMTVPHSLAVPTLLRDSDMLCILPMSLARAFAGAGELAVREPPYPSRPAPLHTIWHSRNEHAPAHIWLRGLVAQAAQHGA